MSERIAATASATRRRMIGTNRIRSGIRKAGGGRSILTAERNQTAVVPAADLGKLKGFCQEAKLAEHAPDGFVPRLRPCAAERLIGVHGLGA